MNSPLVSVVVPCWNGGKFLPGLIECLEAQSLEDFEVIIVDDGSTDPETIARLGELTARYRVIRQENAGLPCARNVGFKAAQAQYVFPLDCDDRIDPTFLSEAYELLSSRSEIAFVFSHMKLTGKRSGILKRSCHPFDQLFLNQLPYALFIRKSCWDEVGGYDESMREGYEDWDFNVRLFAAGYRGEPLPQPRFIYFVDDQGMLLANSASKHARLWRSIRRKHRESYRLISLLRSYRAGGRTKVSLPVAMALLSATWMLPDAWFGRIYVRALSKKKSQKSV